ncbi:hypothetical protein K7432_005572 [Basidiobolus ranarum]|uniref:Uncharacterized protein n=1 Tax=Basidiobolus ranarum TaxID=34480 RepID=A0ABR2W2X1_9FUNG
MIYKTSNYSQSLRKLRKYQKLLDNCPTNDFIVGKYANWFCRLDEPDLSTLLFAVNELRYDVLREEEAFSEITFDGDYLLSRRQQRALAFLGRTNEALTLSRFEETFVDSYSIGCEDTPKHSFQYDEKFKWLCRCTPNDLFGIIWLVGEIRARWVDSATKLSQFQERPREAIKGLISLAQDKPIWYRRAGWKVQIPEYYGRRSDWWWHCIKCLIYHRQ